MIILLFNPFIMLKKNKAFTLLEILLVIGIIAILAGIVIIAINPSKQLASVRNTERLYDLKQIYNATQQYYIDHNVYPATIPTSLTEICDTGANPSTTTAQDGTPCGTLINLSSLVPTYLVAIPKDPQGPMTAFLEKLTTTAYAAIGGNGYQMMRDTNNKIALQAPKAENAVTVTIGPVVTSSGSGCVATGGTITTSGRYKIHTFTDVATSTFTITSGPCNVDILVVAGGGGGGGGAGGGGGGGGVIMQTNYPLSVGSLTVSVGAGGNGASNGYFDLGINGNDSIFGDLIAIGGGGGGYLWYGQVGSDGGSGGGGSYGGNATYGNGGSGTVGQGYAGGRGAQYDIAAGGGGGGAGEAGSDASDVEPPRRGGDGGDGVACDFSGISNYYGGGGGGGPWDTGVSVSSNGGLGGGGASGDGHVDGSGTPGANGTSNTGGGGGGGGYMDPDTIGGNGGSGIVIVKYAI